jgi:hypothetical protein
MIAIASWSHSAQGYRLHVRPTLFGRTVADQHSFRALTQALRLARPPLHLTAAVTDSLRNQLRCHAAFAPHKPAWNLEAWRPDVGYGSTVLHACNP